MKRRLRRFLGVGLAVTLFDGTVLVVLVVAAGWHPVAADAVAVVLAALVSFLAHRQITFADDPYALIDHRFGAFVLAVVPSALTDVVVLAVVTGGASDPAVAHLVVAKGVAVLLAAGIRLFTYRRVLFAAVRADQAIDTTRATLDGEVRLTVVVPAYRDGDRIAATVDRVRAALATLDAEGAGRSEILVVDDGSGDGTAAAAGGADRVLVQPENRGKGAAVRRGVLAAQGRSVVFTDADLAYPPEQIVDLVRAVERGYDVVVGNRRHPDTRVELGATRTRELGSVLFNLITSIVLLGAYRDTQCGLKGFRRDVGRLLFARSRIDRFAFDVEILHLVERYRLSLFEVPVVLADEERSTISLLPAATRMVRDVLAVRRVSARGLYDLERPLGEELADIGPVAAPVRSSG